jgi:DNA repair photolyase
VTILTKAGTLATEGILQLRPGDAFATTLTLLSQAASLFWEPHAALPGERLINLIVAEAHGINTWVSCEPVIDTEATLELIRTAHRFTGHFKVGKLNYHPQAELVNWPVFARRVVDLLDSLAASYYIKKDLARYLPPEILKRLRQSGATL